MKEIEDKITAFAAASEDEALALLERLVLQNSFTENFDGINAVQTIIEEEVSSLPISCERIKKDTCGDFLVLKTKSAGDDYILLSGHADTVHPPDSAFNSFWIESRKAFGPGVLDMKGGLVTIIQTLRALSHVDALESIPLTVLINSDEETGSLHSRPIIDSLCKNASAALVYEYGRPGNAIVTRRKGRGNFTIEVKGRTAHAGNDFSNGVNAIVVAAKVIEALAAISNPSLDLTCNIGKILGGEAPNVIPDFATIAVEVRAPQEAPLNEATKQIESILSTHSRGGASCAVSESKLMLPLERTESVGRLLEEFSHFANTAGIEVTEHNSVVGGLSNANDIAANRVPVLDGLGPFGEFAHTDKEYLAIDSMTPKLLNSAFWLHSKKID